MLLSSLLESWGTLRSTTQSQMGRSQWTLFQTICWLKNLEGKKKVQIINMKQMLLRSKEEVNLVGEMNLVEETKAKPKVILNLAQEQQYVIIVAKKVIRDLNAYFWRETKKLKLLIQTQLIQRRRIVLQPQPSSLTMIFVLIGKDNYLNVAYGYCSWIVDSSASFHVSPHEDFFSNYKKGDYETMKIGNHVTRKIVGIGDIVLLTDTWNKLELKKVRHVPKMRLNLISTSKLDDVGFISHFCTRKWKLGKGNLVIIRGSKEWSLYIMQGRICSGEANVATDSKDVWHRRLGHMSEKTLEMLVKNHLPGIKD